MSLAHRLGKPLYFKETGFKLFDTMIWNKPNKPSTFRIGVLVISML